MIRLTDAEMQSFVRNGYIKFRPDYPPELHEAIRRKTDQMLEKWGNPRNNLLPRIPEIQHVFDHPRVHGALSSILGDDYYLHLHRHVHSNMPGSKGQGMHKDSLNNSRFAVDDNRRHHHTRWAMAFYYPQDTPVEMGPTAAMPQSQYLNTRERFEDAPELPLSGEAGTVTIVHYDVLHRAMPNKTDKVRHMVKFLFTRMSEPSVPSWTGDARWEPSDDPQERIWHHVWEWHGGPNGRRPQPSKSVAELSADLGGESETASVNAAYELALSGEEGVQTLIEALSDESGARRRDAGYGLSSAGEAAAEPLTEAARSEDAGVRARAIDALGDLGQNGRAGMEVMIDALGDESHQLRRHAVEALGTAAQDCHEAVEPIANALKDDNDVVRRSAALSLARMGETAAPSVPALSEALSDPHYYVRGFSVQALRQIGTPEATEALVHYLEATRWDPAQG